MDELVQYIRRGGAKKYHTFNGRKKQSKRCGGKRIGVMVSWVARNGEIKVGWSLCHRVDTFDTTSGLNTARQQAINLAIANHDYINTVVPYSISKKYTKFVDRIVDLHSGGGSVTSEENGAAEISPV